MKRCMFIYENNIDYIEINEKELYEEAQRILKDSNVSSTMIKIDEGLFARCYHHDFVRDDEFKFWGLADSSGRGYCPNECLIILIDPACSPIDIFQDTFDEEKNYIDFGDSLISFLELNFIKVYNNNGKGQPILLVK